MGIKIDLAAFIKMSITAESNRTAEAIEEYGKCLAVAKHGLETSYARLEEAQAEGNERNVRTIEAYIEYLQTIIEEYETIQKCFENTEKARKRIDEQMDCILRDM
jgi:hypothetical protein